MKIKPEWRIIGLVLLSALLFAWGGTGLKAARRFMLPFVLAGGGFSLGLDWKKCLMALPLMVGAFCLPYGESSHVIIRGLTALSFGLCLLPMAHRKNWFVLLIPPAAFAANYFISLNWAPWTHKIVELSAGFFLGITVTVLSLSKKCNAPAAADFL